MTPAAVWGRLVGAGRHDETVPRDLTLPPDYAALLADLKNQVRAAQLRAHRVVNTDLLTLYWRIGDAIRTWQEKAGWGAKAGPRKGRVLAGQGACDGSFGVAGVVA